MKGTVIVSSGIPAEDLLDRLSGVRHAGAMALGDCPASVERHELRLIPLGLGGDADVRAVCTGGCLPEALLAAIAGREIVAAAPSPEHAPNAVDASMLSLPQAGRALGLAPRTVRARIRDGSLPGSFLGGRWRIRREDLAAFVEGGRFRAEGGMNVTPHVVILTWCWRPEALYGSTLVFKTLRVGFPTARVTVFDNRSVPACRNEIRAAAAAAGCEFIVLEDPVSHDAWVRRVRRVLTEYPLAGPVAIVDPDVVFWSNVEGWDFGAALLAGRLIPDLIDDIVMHARTMPRLHTSFLWVPDVARLRTRIRAFEERERIGTVKPLRLVEQAVVLVPRGRLFFDTAANLYAAIREECAPFGEIELDAYDHLFLGSHVEILERSGAIAPGELTLHHVAARDGNLEVLRGMWRRQEEHFRAHAVGADAPGPSDGAEAVR